jgi:RNA polymerase sigma factor (sigma-70 family)
MAKRCKLLPDETLLKQFLAGADLESQDAFSTLVKRHGPRVLGICRSVLDQEQDAEDAFQTTLFALAQEGASIRNGQTLPCWLDEVAYRVAVRMRDRERRHRFVEKRAMMVKPPRAAPIDLGDDAFSKELRPILEEEVVLLPEKYRLPFILSYLEGKTNHEVAELLHCPVGTVKGRLFRARRMLRLRLSWRGIALTVAFLLTVTASGNSNRGPTGKCGYTFSTSDLCIRTC